MIIPYAVDVCFDRRPWANYLVVALIIVAFLLEITSLAENRHAIDAYVLKDFGITGLFGYMWLHGGFLHIVGNLIFLWVFGNAVCSKIGNLAYVPAYVGLGVVSGIGQLLFDGQPTIGASGVINAIVGMYLVLFPKNDISCFYWFFFRFGTFSCSSYWMVFYWFAWDILGMFWGHGNAAYSAHITGFVAGFALAVTMLITKWVVMEKDENSLLEILGIHKKTVMRYGLDGKLRPASQSNTSIVDNKTSFSNDAPSSRVTDQELQNLSQSLSPDDFPTSSPMPQVSFNSLDFDDIGADKSAAQTLPVAAEFNEHISAASHHRQVSERKANPNTQSDFLRFSCACGHKFKVTQSHGGKSGRCPHCKAIIRIPKI